MSALGLMNAEWKSFHQGGLTDAVQLSFWQETSKRSERSAKLPVILVNTV